MNIHKEFRGFDKIIEMNNADDDPDDVCGPRKFKCPHPECKTHTFTPRLLVNHKIMRHRDRMSEMQWIKPNSTQCFYCNKSMKFEDVKEHLKKVQNREN